MIGEIPPVQWPNVQKVLPAVYGDELSYYELLAKMEKVVNDLIEQANAVGVEVNQFEEALRNIDNIDEIDAQIQALQSLVETLQGELESIQLTIDALPSYAEFVTLSQRVQENTDNKIPFPVQPNEKYGTDGQVLRTNGDGSTQWQNPIEPTDEQADTYITAWLNAHPEATTTVLDGSITTPKIANGAVTLEKLGSDVEMPPDGSVTNAKLALGVFDPIPLTFPYSGFVNAEYEFQESTAYKCTDFIPITEPFFVQFARKQMGYAVYDALYNGIARENYTNRSYVCAIRGAYIRIFAGANADTSDVTFPVKVDAAGYNGVDSYSKSRVSPSSLRGCVYHNIIQPDKLVNNFYIRVADGELSGPAANYFCTLPIPVEPNTRYRFSKGRAYAFYDANYNYISGNTEITGRRLTTPANCYYLSCSINKVNDAIQFDEYEKWYIAKESEYDASEPYYTATPTPPWTQGKTVAWMGDSIVAAEDFDEIVSDTLGMIETDYGINGSTIALQADGTNPRDAMVERYTEITEHDIIIISGGTNDYQYSIPDFGNINSTSNTTFYGALKNLCEGLITMFPEKTIVFTTPIKRAQPFSGSTPTTPFSRNEKGKTLKDYRDAIIEVCGYYSIPVCDLWGESQLNPHIPAQQYMFDSALTHPNDIGRQLMARRVSGWLASLFKFEGTE